MTKEPPAGSRKHLEVCLCGHEHNTASVANEAKLPTLRGETATFASAVGNANASLTE